MNRGRRGRAEVLFSFTITKKESSGGGVFVNSRVERSSRILKERASGGGSKQKGS